jgi:hypothetical protein
MLYFITYSDEYDGERSIFYPEGFAIMNEDQMKVFYTNVTSGKYPWTFMIGHAMSITYKVPEDLSRKLTRRTISEHEANTFYKYLSMPERIFGVFPDKVI